MTQSWVTTICKAITAKVHAFSYPHVSIKCLDKNDGQAEASKRRMQRDWELLLQLESLAFTRDDTFKELLTAVFWRQSELIRLIFTVNEIELVCTSQGRPLPEVSCLDRLLRQLHERWPHEKPAEDVHQHIRDQSRQTRNPSIAPERIYETVRAADIPHEYGLASLNIDHETAMDHCRRRSIDRSYAEVFRGPVRDLHRRLNRILDPAHRNPSPTLAGEVAGVSAWMWAKYYLQHFHERQLKSPRAASISKLCQERWIIANGDEAAVVVSQHEWHVLVFHVREVGVAPITGNARYSLDVRPGSMEIRHVTELAGWTQAPCHGVYHDDGVVVLEVENMFDDLLAAALLQGVKLNGQDVALFMKELFPEFDIEWPGNKKRFSERFDILLEGAFEGRPDDLALARKRYATPDSDDDDGDEADDELLNALNWLDQDDPDNQELTSYFKQLELKKKLRRVEKRLQKVRKARAKKKAKAEARKAAKAKAKAKAAARKAARAKAKAEARDRKAERRSGRMAFAMRMLRRRRRVEPADPPAVDVLPPDEHPSPPPGPEPAAPAPAPVPGHFSLPVVGRGPRQREAASNARQWNTPYQLRPMLPAGYSIYINAGSLHWKVVCHVDKSFLTTGFGVRSGRSVGEAADVAVQQAWDAANEERPEAARFDVGSVEEWLGPALGAQLTQNGARF